MASEGQNLRIRVLACLAALVTGCLSASCGSVPDEFVDAIRDTGFECDGLTASQQMDESGNRWRIACGNARTYLTSLEDDGSICVSPLAYVEIPVTDIEREFQWPPQDAEVVRCTNHGSG